MKIKVYSYWQEDDQWKQGYKDTDLIVHLKGSYWCWKQMWKMRLNKWFNLEL